MPIDITPALVGRTWIVEDEVGSEAASGILVLGGIAGAITSSEDC